MVEVTIHCVCPLIQVRGRAVALEAHFFFQWGWDRIAEELNFILKIWAEYFKVEDMWVQIEDKIWTSTTERAFFFMESNSNWIVSFAFENSKYLRGGQTVVKKRMEVPFQKAQNWADFEEIWDILHWLRKGGRKTGREGGMQYQSLRLSKDNWVTSTLWSFPQGLLQHLWHFSKDCLKD